MASATSPSGSSCSARAVSLARQARTLESGSDGGLVLQDFQRAVELYHASQKAEAEAEAAGERGEGGGEAALRLAQMYENGEGVAQDLVRARRYYELAAARGQPDAMMGLGLLYHNGLGVEQDVEKASDYYLSAGRVGRMHAREAHCYMGALIRHGLQPHHFLADEGGKVEADTNGIDVVKRDDDAVERMDHRRDVEKEAGSAPQQQAQAKEQEQQLVLQQAQQQKQQPEENATTQDPDELPDYPEIGMNLTNLGLNYYQGSGGMPKDMARCVLLYERAATACRYPRAQYLLGVLYENGDGVPQDPQQALELFEDSAAQKYAPSEYRLGWLLLNDGGTAGINVKGDLRRVVRLYQDAADQGFPQAVGGLGGLYEDGKGVPQDYARAAEIFTRGAALGDTHSKWRLACLYRDGHGVPRDPERAFSMLHEIITSGLSEASTCFDLAMLYYTGLGVERSYERCAELCRAAAGAGYAEAAAHMAWLFHMGYGVPVNLPAAGEWYELAGKDVTAASTNLGALLSQVHTRDGYIRAALCWRRSADAGDPRAMYNLAGLYLVGDGLTQNTEKAIELLKQAAELDFTPAQELLMDIALSADQDLVVSPR